MPGDQPARPTIATLHVKFPRQDEKSAKAGVVAPQGETNIELHDEGILRLGRMAANDLQLPYANVSRFHAIFSASRSGVIVSDLSSSNGTRVNGERISSPVSLRSGDVVVVGDTKLTVRVHLDEAMEGDFTKAQTTLDQMSTVVVTILLADVCSYTSLSEELPPEELTTMLNRWFELASDIVKKHGGEVDKYIGDCVMALWRSAADSDPEEEAIAATRAGLEIIAASEEFAVSGVWKHQETHPWRCRIALNTGEAMFGPIGGKGAHDYTALGDSVNVAFRLESIADDYDCNVILGERTAKCIVAEFPTVQLGEAELEGKREEVDVYTISQDASFEINATFLLEEVREVFEAVRRDPLVASILERLKTDLPPDLEYHAAPHSLGVLYESIYLAIYDKKPWRQILLLGIAAAYHDAGFLERKSDNEVVGAEIAARAMEQDGRFTGEEIAQVHRMILDTTLVDEPTSLRQIPHTDLSCYLLDADLSNLGQDNFFDRLEATYRETGVPRTAFLERTLSLMENHKWLTNAAKELRSEKKRENLERLKKMITERTGNRGP